MQNKYGGFVDVDVKQKGSLTTVRARIWLGLIAGATVSSSCHWINDMALEILVSIWKKILKYVLLRT